MKCGHALPYRPGMMVAGQSASAAVRATPSVKVAQPGGFLVRLVAFVIDWLILGTIWLGVWFLWQATLAPAQFDPNAGAQTYLAYHGQQVVFLLVAVYMIRRLYFQGSWTILGGSPGMRVLNLQIVDKEGQPIGFRRAYLRYLVLYGLLSLPNLVVSPFMVAFTERKTGLHDLIAGTYVIQYLDPEGLPMPAAGAMPPGLATAGAIAGAGAVAAIASGPTAGASPLGQAPAMPAAPAPPTRAPVPPPQFPPDAAPVAAAPATQAPVVAAAATRAPVPPPQFPLDPGPAKVAAAPQPAPSPLPIDPFPPQRLTPPQPAAPADALPQAARPAPPPDPGRDLYSPTPGAVPAPATIAPTHSRSSLPRRIYRRPHHRRSTPARSRRRNPLRGGGYPPAPGPAP